MYLRAKRGLSVVQESLKVQLKTGINALEEFVEVCSISKEEQRKSFPVSVPSIVLEFAGVAKCRGSRVVGRGRGSCVVGKN